MRRTRLPAAALCLLLAVLPDARAHDAAPDTKQPPAFEGRVQQALLDPGSGDEARSAALAATVALAEAGNGLAAFQLAALFRNGEAHPAKATPRDLDTARYWLERCLTMQWCPRTVLAAMAELLLDADQPQEAMSWAQAAAMAEREVMQALAAEKRAPANAGNQAYNAALLKRIYARLPREQAREDVVNREFQAWLAQLRPVLQQLVAREVDGVRRYAKDAPLRLASQPRRVSTTGVASKALFLLRVPVGGTQPDLTLVVDGLPTPRDAQSLRKVAAALRFEPAVATDGDTAVYTVAPIELDDGRVALKKNRVNAQ